MMEMKLCLDEPDDSIVVSDDNKYKEEREEKRRKKKEERGYSVNQYLTEILAKDLKEKNNG